MAIDIIAIFVTPVIELVKCLWSPIGYVVQYHENVRGLKRRVAELGTIRDRVRKDADEALLRGEIIEDVWKTGLRKLRRLSSP